MPGLKVVITGDAGQFKNEMASIEAAAKRAGAAITKNIEGGAVGAHGGGKSGAMRETLVLLREIGRGNWNRVPGSLSILVSQLQQMGIFGAISLKTLAFGLGAVAVAALFVYETFVGMKNALKGFELPDLKPDKYIPKLLRNINDAIAAQRRLTDEVQRTVDAYNSAAEAAKRTAEKTDEYFQHLLKMNEFQKDPARRAANELEIKEHHRAAQVENARNEKRNLEEEAREKSAAARAVKVPTEAEDERTRAILDQNAEAAQIYKKKIEGRDTWENIKQNAAIKFGGSPFKMAKRQRAIEAAMDMGEEEADKAIAIFVFNNAFHLFKHLFLQIARGEFIA